MKINVKYIDNEVEIPVRNQNTCEHIIDTDVVDMGDDGDGYDAYGIVICRVCGKEWSTAQANDEFGYSYED